MLTILKIILSLAALLLAFFSLEGQVQLPALTEIKWSWVAAGVGCVCMATLMLILRYRTILRYAGVDLPWAEAAQLQLIGHWFNLTLPTGYIGDGIKIGLRAKRDGATNLLAAVFFERVLGLGAVCVVGLLLLLPHLQLLGMAGQAIILCYAGFVGCGLLLMLLRAATLPVWVPRWPWLAKIHAVLTQGKPRWLGQGFALSLGIHLATISVFVMLGAALNLNINLVTYAVIVPAVLVAGLLPISYAGWGVREVSAIHLFSLVGVSGAEALALTVAFGVLNTLCAAPGLVCFLLHKNKQAAPS